MCTLGGGVSFQVLIDQPLKEKARVVIFILERFVFTIIYLKNKPRHVTNVYKTISVNENSCSATVSSPERTIRRIAIAIVNNVLYTATSGYPGSIVGTNVYVIDY